MLHMFYQSVVASTVSYAVVCWGVDIKVKFASRLNKLIKKAVSVIGSRLVMLEEVVEDRMLAKLLVIMDTPYTTCQPSKKLIQPWCVKR